jgi:hypothetical protein
VSFKKKIIVNNFFVEFDVQLSCPKNQKMCLVKIKLTVTSASMISFHRETERELQYLESLVEMAIILGFISG